MHVASRLLRAGSRNYASLSKDRFILKQENAVLPKGYLVAATHCGIKKKANALDLGILVSQTSNTSAAAVFTKNVFKAAPVQVSTQILKQNNGAVQSVVINSGCANAVTGEQGLKDAWAMSTAADALAKSDKPASLVMSTGVIGQLLPIDKITTGISSLSSKLASDFEAWHRLAQAFMTTDTFPKLRTKTFKLQGKDVTLAGIDKGAGMIHPNMGPPHATLLGLIATDANITPQVLQEALTYAVNRSFNCISVDGDMSTNDTVLLLANGASSAPQITSTGDKDYEVFRDELTTFAVELASLVVRDGEGATKFVKISVNGTPSYEDAHHIAATIAKSSLVKTAIHGEDANWGRILCAVGYSTPSSFTVEPTKVCVSFVPKDGSLPLKLLVNGEPEKVDEERAKVILQEEDLEIRVELGAGSESAAYYTCDLSKEYISINADYRS